MILRSVVLVVLCFVCQIHCEDIFTVKKSYGFDSEALDGFLQEVTTAVNEFPTSYGSVANKLGLYLEDKFGSYFNCYVSRGPIGSRVQYYTYFVRLLSDTKIRITCYRSCVKNV